MKCLFWLGDALHILRGLPPQVRIETGVALFEVQQGGKPDCANPLKGLGKGITGIHEIVVDHDKETYRSVYVAKLKKGVYVLHVFHKNSKHGIGIPREDVEKIVARYRQAVENEKPE